MASVPSSFLSLDVSALLTQGHLCGFLRINSHVRIYTFSVSPSIFSGFVKADEIVEKCQEGILHSNIAL
jgi:hypothetical protein